MPRKNYKQKAKVAPFQFRQSTSKRRYSSRAEAQKVADYQMALDLNLELFVYQDIDGGWYLTRKNHTN